MSNQQYQAYNPEIEAHLIATLLQFPDTWGEISSLINQNDFDIINRPIFLVLKQQLEAMQPLTIIVLADKLGSYGVDTSKLGGLTPYDYLWALSMKPVKREDAVNLLRQLKIISVRRDLILKCRQAEQELRNTSYDSLSDMVEIVDKTLTSVNTSFYKQQDTQEMFSTIESVIEERGNNPVDPESIGYTGVFPSIDRSLGALIGKAQFVNVSARQGNGKSSMAFFYNIMTAEKHNLPILWCDAGEMTMEQLQFRAVCCLSEGRIPLWAVRSGRWRQHIEWDKIIRHDIWPRVKKLKLHYRSVAGMSPKDKISFMKRFYFNKIGRGNMLIIVDDYLKGVESLGKNSQEYQEVGYYVAGVKSLITDEIDASFWTSTQSNRSGVYKGKKIADIVDNDSVVSLSDRINHNATHSFLMRYKVPEELALEKNKFGNVVMKVLKIRDGLGRDYENFMKPIKLPTGGFAENYFNVNYGGFFYRDMGWYSTMLEMLGQGIIVPDTNTGEKTITL